MEQNLKPRGPLPQSDAYAPYTHYFCTSSINKMNKGEVEGTTMYITKYKVALNPILWKLLSVLKPKTSENKGCRNEEKWTVCIDKKCITSIRLPVTNWKLVTWKQKFPQEENIAPTPYKVMSETLYVNKTIPEMKRRHLQKYLELPL
jgi:hypothetical protein